MTVLCSLAEDNPGRLGCFQRGDSDVAVKSNNTQTTGGSFSWMPHTVLCAFIIIHTFNKISLLTLSWSYRENTPTKKYYVPINIYNNKSHSRCVNMSGLSLTYNCYKTVYSRPRHFINCTCGLRGLKIKLLPSSVLLAFSCLGGDLNHGDDDDDGCSDCLDTITSSNPAWTLMSFWF